MYRNAFPSRCPPGYVSGTDAAAASLLNVTDTVGVAEATDLVYA
jgi:hypothetical protein